MDAENRIMIRHTRAYREKLLADPYRPRYHFAIPDDDGRPGDPNGMFWANGEYHLMYLYRRDGGDFCWGHMSSVDLLHWRQHSDALKGGPNDNGCFSGGAFVDDDGTAWLSYWIFNDREQTHGRNAGIGLARSAPPYETWERLPDAVIPSTEWGICDEMTPDGNTIHLGCADPSNIWKRDGVYYMQTGNLLVLNKYGRAADSPAVYGGDWTELFASEDLMRWKHLGRFYERAADDSWTDATEDDMCPSYLPLPPNRDGGTPSGKMLQLFIAHNKGCQYYIGHEEGVFFRPEKHGRMSWVDNTFFAPEACVDGRGRQIMFAWLNDNIEDDFQKYGWSGVYSLPRALWLNEDGDLGIAPTAEVEALSYLTAVLPDRTIADENLQAPLPIGHARCCRISFDADVRDASQAGVEALISQSGGRGVLIYYDAVRQELVFDPNGCDTLGRGAVERAPLMLQPGEPLRLTVYVDNAVVEVFANDRQAISRRAYTDPVTAGHANLFARGRAVFSSIQTAAMAAANPY
ncbi:MAG: glycoside hydrolase family 32 protein [Clostridia bacterium]|nr:glycoside hydrolase family 32 protein [Clostridia bacterium]